jgi:D-sedoheptulose 7-phosphate isomerase
MNPSHDIISSLNQAHGAADIYLEKKTLHFIETFTSMLVTCFKEGGKLLVCGNGGSLCDAMHVAEEFTGQFRKTRKALPAIALADASHITCVANDMGFDQVFSRGVEAFGKPKDILLILSTSGNSKNVVHALEKAKELGLFVVSLLGKGGGALKGKSDCEILVDGFIYSDRIQEIHMTLMHIVIEACENRLFYQSSRHEDSLLCP